MGQQLREGPVVFAQDLAGSTLSTVYPAGAAAGVAPSAGGRGGRVVIMARAQISAPPMSCQVHVYGYDAGSGNWGYINSLLGGASIGSSTVRGPDASTAVLLEGLCYSTGAPVFVENYARYATRLVCSGASSLHTVSTYVGATTE